MGKLLIPRRALLKAAPFVLAAPAILKSRPAFAAYLGPGDLVGGALNYWGLRAFSAAKLATAPYAAIEISDNTGAFQTSINILASTATLDLAAIAGWGHGTPFVNRIFDQVTGTNYIVFSSRPTLVISPTGLATGMPTMVFAGASIGSSVLNIPTQAQPLAIIAFQIRTSGATQFTQGIFGGPYDLIGENTLTTAFLYAGTTAESASSTVAENVWHGLGGRFDGASSILSVDGGALTMTPSNPGTQSPNNTTPLTLNTSGGVGSVCEVALWPAWTGAQLNSYTNKASGNPNDGSVTFWTTASGGGGGSSSIMMTGSGQ